MRDPSGRGGATAAPGSGSSAFNASSRLFVEAARHAYRLPYHHAREANGEVASSGLGPVVPAGSPLLHVAERQDVVVYPLETVAASPR